MLDPFVFLAPILLLPVVALLRFVGCAAILGLEDATYLPVFDSVDIDPPPPILLRPSESKRFKATASWDSNAAIVWSDVSHGALTRLGREAHYVAPPPGLITVFTNEIVRAKAMHGGNDVTGEVLVLLIPDTTTPPPPPPPPPLTRTPLMRVNCGNAATLLPDPDGKLAWQPDTGFFTANGPTSTPAGNVSGALVIYNTAREGRDLTYIFSGLTPNVPHFVTLKFAEIDPRPGGRLFRFSFTRGVPNRTPPAAFDISFSAGGNLKTIDEPYTVTADRAGGIAIRFERVTESALINAIEIAK